MPIIREFKEFAVKGNVVDMAVGIIIGAAFGRIVSSFVADIMMPPLGVLTGDVDFSERRWILRDAQPATDAAAAVTEVSINYGMFINVTINFIIVAFAVFLLVKGINTLKRRQEAQVAPAAPPGPTLDQQLLSEIRDLLRRSS